MQNDEDMGGSEHARNPTGAADDIAQETSLGDTVRRLGVAAQSFAAAEVALVKKRGTIIAGAAGWIAVWGALAFMLAFSMIVTLMVGAILALAPLWGLGLSLLFVTGVALLLLLLCVVGIKAQIGRIREGVR